METTIPPQINPDIQNNFVSILISDLLRPEHYEELEILAYSLGPDILITDKPVPFASAFTLESTKPASLNNGLIEIHNDITIGNIIQHENLIHVTDNNTPHINSNLTCLLGKNFYQSPFKHETWFGRIKGTPAITVGGQPSDHLWWVLLLFGKESNMLEWGLHNMEWLFQCAKYQKMPSNKHNIFFPSKLITGDVENDNTLS